MSGKTRWSPLLTVRIKYRGVEYAFVGMGYVSATRKFIEWLQKFCPEGYDKLVEKLRLTI